MLTVSEIARGVAKDIRRYGHFKSDAHRILALNTFLKQQGLCCIVANPTLRAASCGHVSRFNFEFGFASYVGTDCVIDWSDETPTEEVLAKLEEFADYADSNPSSKE